jgi:hypothetical protein
MIHKISRLKAVMGTMTRIDEKIQLKDSVCI